MSAEVIGCGFACHLMEIDFIEDIPQVHLHFLTESDEYEELKYGKVEIVCHGCGEAVLVYYDEASSNGNRHLKVRDSFAAKHQRCPSRVYEEHCPNYRSKIQVVDLRSRSKTKRWPEAKKPRRTKRRVSRKTLSPRAG